MNCDPKKIYLAHLYSIGTKLPDGSFDENMLAARFEHSNMIAAKIMEDLGHIVFSPISHSHPIQKYCNPELWVHTFWLKQDKSYLLWCDELWIAIDNSDPYDWKNSIGVRWEKFLIHLMRKPAKEVWIDTGQLCSKIL